MDFDNKPDHFTDDHDNTFAPLIPHADEHREAAAQKGAEEERPGRNIPRWAWWTLACVVVALTVACWIRYFTPYVTDATVTGYVTNVERRGILFRTFEGEMITQYNLTDTTRTYQREFTFSVDNDSLALALQATQGTGRPVRITYKTYYATVPWRGASKTIVTSMETLPNLK